MGSIGIFVLMAVIGGLITWRGLDAVRTKRFRGKYGLVYTGATAVWLGRLFLVVGPLVILGTLVKTIIDLT